MGFGELIEPVDSLPRDTRNQTPLSRYCESLVEAFLGHGAEAARVRAEMAEYGADDLYGGLRRICGRKRYFGRVEAHMRNGEVMLERKR